MNIGNEVTEYHVYNRYNYLLDSYESLEEAEEVCCREDNEYIDEVTFDSSDLTPSEENEWLRSGGF